jgi:hypothetical protein
VTGATRLVRFRAEWEEDVPADDVPQEGASLAPEKRRLVVQSVARGEEGLLIVELAPEAAWRVRVYLSEGPERANGHDYPGRSWQFDHTSRDLAGALDAVAQWTGDDVLPRLVRPVGGWAQLHYLEPDGLGRRQLLDDRIPEDYRRGFRGRPTVGLGDRRDILDALEAFCDEGRAPVRRARPPGVT